MTDKLSLKKENGTVAIENREKAEFFAEHLNDIITPNPGLDIEEETTKKTEEEAVTLKEILETIKEQINETRPCARPCVRTCQ